MLLDTVDGMLLAIVLRSASFLADSVDRVEQTIKGAALVPKRALDVMSCEVDRLLVLSQGYIIPLSYCVPRKVRWLNVHFCASLYSIYCN